MHHHHNHIDEFSVTDIRHTIGEAWRVVSGRRWWFLFPFCIASTLAFVASHAVPRKYTTSMTFERRNDPVLMGMLAERWTQAYEEQRSQLGTDIARTDVIRDVVARIWPETAADGGGAPEREMTPGAALVSEISKGLRTSYLKKTSNRDVIQMDLTLEDPQRAPAVLIGILGKYATLMRQQTQELLIGARDFFEDRSARCDIEIKIVSARLREFERLYPGIESHALDPTEHERMALMKSRGEREQVIDEDLARKNQILRTIDRLRESLDADAPSKDPSLDLMDGDWVPNPRYVDVRAEVEQLRREITDGQTIRLMTDQHPKIVDLRNKLKRRTEELASLSPRIAAALLPTASRGQSPVITERQRLQVRIDRIDLAVAANEAKLATTEQQILANQRRRTDILAHRDEYLRIDDELTAVKSELSTWQGQLLPLNNALILENNDRGVHFAVLEEPVRATKPSAPLSLTIMASALGFGGAIGVIFVLIRELTDRSFRTAKQLSSSLGIPIIESVDEIVTQAMRRKRMIRRFVVMPAATLVVASVTFFAGATAYFSIEDPQRIERIKTFPWSAVQDVAEQS